MRKQRDTAQHKTALNPQALQRCGASTTLNSTTITKYDIETRQERQRIVAIAQQLAACRQIAQHCYLLRPTVCTHVHLSNNCSEPLL
jgi:hypothetical protein